MLIARKQTLVQLTDELVARLDAVAARDSRTRSDLIREAVEALLVRDREAEIDRQIVEAYTRMPETEEELAWGDIGARAIFADGESWDDEYRAWKESQDEAR